MPIAARRTRAGRSLRFPIARRPPGHRGARRHFRKRMRGRRHRPRPRPSCGPVGSGPGSGPARCRARSWHQPEVCSHPREV